MKNDLAIPKTIAYLIGALLVFVIVMLILKPAKAMTMTDAEARRQLALESQNLVTFGNPFGVTGKFEELYDPTGKPWWMIQLDKEAWSMETYGNPFGYPIAQRVIGSPAPSLPIPEVQSPIQPVIVAPSPVQSVVPVPIPVETPHFVGSPYLLPRLPHDADESWNAIRVGIKFSEALTNEDQHRSVYRLYCITPNNPDGVNLWADPVLDKTERQTVVHSGFGTGNYVCKFKYTDPVVIESEAIEFEL